VSLRLCELVEEVVKINESIQQQESSNNNNTKRLTMTSVWIWVQLYYEGEDEPIGDPTRVNVVPKVAADGAHVDDLKDAVILKYAGDLERVAPARLRVWQVHAAGIRLSRLRRQYQQKHRAKVLSAWWFSHSGNVSGIHQQKVHFNWMMRCHRMRP
jgi:hypothetical protein